MPVMAVVSILHRISGVAMVLLIPLLVYLFDLSLRNPQGFQTVLAVLNSTPVRLLEVLLVWMLAHHFFAGVRFLVLDMDWGVEKAVARKSAWLVHGAAVVTTLLIAGALL